MTRVFLDSGVLIQAILTDWGAAKAILILGGHAVFALETSEVVMREVNRALERVGVATGANSDFAKLCATTRITVHPHPSRAEFEDGMRRFLPLMRHAADIPVLVSACVARPDWLVSSNPSHFNTSAALTSGLRIVTPPELMRYLNIHEVPQRSFP